MCEGKLVRERELVREVRGSASHCRGSTVKEGPRFLASRLVVDRAITVCVTKACPIKVCVVEVDSGLCCQGGCRFLKLVKSASTSHRQIASSFVPYLAGRSNLSSLHVLPVDQV